MPEESATPDLEETVRRAVDAYSRRDFDAALALYSLNAVWDTSPLGLGVFEGRDAIRGFAEEWSRAYEDYELELEEFRDLGNGVTLTVLAQRGRLRGSSGFVAHRDVHVVTWVDGLVEQQANYIDVNEARAAAERLAEERG